MSSATLQTTKLANARGASVSSPPEQPDPAESENHGDHYSDEKHSAEIEECDTDPDRDDGEGKVRLFGAGDVRSENGQATLSFQCNSAPRPAVPAFLTVVQAVISLAPAARNRRTASRSPRMMA
jgi:hypothetical protein